MRLPKNLGPINGEVGTGEFYSAYPLLTEAIEDNKVNVLRHVLVSLETRTFATDSGKIKASATGEDKEPDEYDALAQAEFKRRYGRYAMHKIVQAYRGSALDKAVTSNSRVL